MQFSKKLKILWFWYSYKSEKLVLQDGIKTNVKDYYHNKKLLKQLYVYYYYRPDYML